MKRSSRAWILFPALIVILAVFVLVLSNYQKEAGLSAPSKGGIAAVAAAGAAKELASGEGAEALARFTDAVLVARAAESNAALFNPADTRLDHILFDIIDRLTAARDAWRSELTGAWDPAVQGRPGYWQITHPSLKLPGNGTLTATDIRRYSAEQTDELLERAIDLAG